MRCGSVSLCKSSRRSAVSVLICPTVVIRYILKIRMARRIKKTRQAETGKDITEEAILQEWLQFSREFGKI